MQGFSLQFGTARAHRGNEVKGAIAVAALVAAYVAGRNLGFPSGIPGLEAEDEDAPAPKRKPAAKG